MKSRGEDQQMFVVKKQLKWRFGKTVLKLHEIIKEFGKFLTLILLRMKNVKRERNKKEGKNDSTSKNMEY